MKKQYERLHAARVGEGEGGFTLIELLIVIVILGILAAVVVFSVAGITDTGKTSACDAQKKTVEVAIQAYRAKGTAYPATLSGDAGELVTAGLLGEPLGAGYSVSGYNAANGTFTLNCPP